MCSMCEDMELLEMHAMTVQKYDMISLHLIKYVKRFLVRNNIVILNRQKNSDIPSFLQALANVWAAACSSSEPATVLIARAREIPHN
jgi:hypothetical protein